jgi:hypothetical protein
MEKVSEKEGINLPKVIYPLQIGELGMEIA